MKRPIAIAAALALLGGVLALAQGEATPRPKSQDEVRRISAEQAKKALDAGTAVLVDVRDLGVYNAEHAKGAISYNSVNAEAGGAGLPKDKLIITYCT